jgi:hypothetical protein
MFFDRMALLLNIWTALVLGILYLTFQAFPVIFETNHGFNEQSTGLAFLGIGFGMIIAISSQPFWNRFVIASYASPWSYPLDRLFAIESLKFNGKPPPEIRLYMGQLGGILVPIGTQDRCAWFSIFINTITGLFWLAFTSYPHIHWIVPIIASIPFGAGVYFVFTSVFTYLVTVYRPIAASAMASNSAMRSTFAAAFPLFAGAMYHRLGTVGATALMASLAAIMAPLP